MGSISPIIIIIIVIVVVFGIFVFIKRKKGGAADKLQNKQQDNEVRQTIKKFLREKEEYGKEIIDSFVVKRPDPRVDKSFKKQRQEEKETLKALKVSNPEEYKVKKELKKIENRKKPKELYVVQFTTRDSKTQIPDPSRMIECEVIYKKVNKNTNQRTILINQELDYEVEKAWFQPIFDKENKELMRRMRVEQKRQERKKAKQNKKNNK